jgi:hypothetical protein
MMYTRLQSANSIDEVVIVIIDCKTDVKSCDMVLKVFSLFHQRDGGSGVLGCLRKSDIFCLKQVIQHHDFFLDKCLRECLLLLPELLKVSFSLLCFL